MKRNLNKHKISPLLTKIDKIEQIQKRKQKKNILLENLINSSNIVNKNRQNRTYSKEKTKKEYTSRELYKFQQHC